MWLNSKVQTHIASAGVLAQVEGGVVIAPLVLDRALVVPGVSLVGVLKHKVKDNTQGQRRWWEKGEHLATVLTVFCGEEKGVGMTYQDGECGHPLVLLPLLGLHPGNLLLTFLHKVSIAQPSDLCRQDYFHLSVAWNLFDRVHDEVKIQMNIWIKFRQF